MDTKELNNELLRRIHRDENISPNHSLSNSPEVEPDDEGSGEKDEGTDDIVGDTIDGVIPESIMIPCHANKVFVRNVLIMCNPTSGTRRGPKIAKKAVSKFAERGINTHVIPLTGKGHAEELCKTLDLSNYDILCIVGGDGTFHECVNGIMQRSDEEGKRIPLAIIPGGTGNSLVLELLGEAKTGKSIRHIMRGVSVPIDICKITFPNQKEIYSFNSLHWGLASKVSIMAERLRWMGNAIRYTTAAFVELFKGESTLATVVLEEKDGKILKYVEPFCLVIANNIRTAAKGMKMAPKAKINDGLIDVLLIRSCKTIDLANIFLKVYNGSHTDLPFVEYRQVRKFSVTPYRLNGPHGLEVKDDSLKDPEVCEEVIDIDGELKGLTPFVCEVIPLALRVIL